MIQMQLVLIGKLRYFVLKISILIFFYYFWLHFYRFCYHEKSPSIFPVGFCEANNIALTPPNGYDAKTFRWDKYLAETNSLPASEHLFHHHRVVPNHGFKVDFMNVFKKEFFF